MSLCKSSEHGGDIFAIIYKYSKKASKLNHTNIQRMLCSNAELACQAARKSIVHKYKSKAVYL